MKGYRTIIINVLALVFSILAMQGVEITPEDQATVSTGILAIINIVLRFITTTKIGEKE